MLKKIPQQKFLPSLLLSAFASIAIQNVQAQSVTIYRTGVIVPPIYTKVSDALSTAIANDSIVLSAHTFYENNLSIDKNLKITGNVTSSGRSVINAENKNRAILITDGQVTIKDLVIKNGKMIDGAGGGVCNYGTKTLTIEGNSVVDSCSSVGVFSNGGGIFSSGRLNLYGNSVVSNSYADGEGGGIYANGTFSMIGNSSVNNNKSNGSGGGIFAKSNGACTIGGYAVISKNEAKDAGGGLFGVGTIQDNALIAQNKAENGGGIAAFNDVIIIQDSATIDGNIASGSGAGLWLNNCNLYARNNFHFVNNTIVPDPTIPLHFGGSIYNVNGNMYINSGVFKHNISDFANIYNTVNSYAEIEINETIMYNHKSDKSRIFEVYNSNASSGTTIDYTSNFCWYGKSDTIGLIGSRLGTPRPNTPSYIICNWKLNDLMPISPDSSTFPLTTEFRLDNGGLMDTTILRNLNGYFTADKGHFAPANSYIDSQNIVGSRYFAPSVDDTINIIAYVDADTFKATKIAVKGLLGIAPSKQLASQNIQVYPNPTNAILFIKDAPNGSKISLYSITGQLLQTKTNNQITESLDLSNLSTGTYILSISNNEGLHSSAAITKY